MKKAVSLILTLILIFSLTVCAFAEKSEKEFRFKDDGTFKIVVFSDTQDDRYPSYDMQNFVRLMLEENTDADLVIFTGDLVEDSRFGDIATDAQPFKEGVVVKSIGGDVDIEKTVDNIKVATDNVLSILEESGIPYAIAQGNNDYKCSIGGKDWLDIYSKYDNCLITDESDDPDDRLDYNLEIKNDSGETKFNIWLMDTGRGGVNSQQIEWYKSESDALTQANGGTPVPSLLFQHVQVDDIGNLFEECSMFDDGARGDGLKFYRLNRDIAHGYNFFAYEPGKTTAEFSAWKEKGDIIGAFFGHQHVEGFSGVYEGIELGFTYGCEFAKTGPYGYRVITLHEDDLTNYDTELYTYKGTVKLNNAHFEKQVDETSYKVYDNFVEKLFSYVKNFFSGIVYFFIGLFA